MTDDIRAYEEALEKFEAAQVALAEAQAAKDAAGKVFQEAQAARTADRYQSEFDAMMALPDEAFVDDDPGFDFRPYVLPFGQGYKKFNPHDDDDRANHDFGSNWTRNMTAIICKKDERDEATRLIWTSGYPVSADSDRVSSDAIGNRFEARHDQTNARLGIYQIVGLAVFGPDAKLARVIGNVPNRKFNQSTYK
jgi:hypothetical protein